MVGLVDRALDGTVVLLATWTVVYHVSLLLGIGSTWALAIEALALTALILTAVAVTRLSSRPSAEDLLQPARGAPARSLLGMVTVASALVAAGAMSLDLAWAAVWVPWLVAAVSGTALVVVHHRPDANDEEPAARDDGSGARFAVFSALVLAVFATITLRPNPDDLFYVNLSQWIAEKGEFPLRDTIFSDLGYPMANWPPLASYDALTGAVAHLLGLRAGDVVYVAVPPVATALAVLALWRLLRAWRVRHLVVALAAALLFLLLDGTVSYGTPGNLFLTRLWQGKVILLCVLVPTLLTYALQYAERPTRRQAAWLALGGAAAVACSTTAQFLVPVIAVAAAAPLLLLGEVRRAGTAFVALAAYPLGAALVTLAVGGRSADDFGERRQYRFDPAWFGHEVFLTGVLALVAVLAVLLGTQLVPHPAARMTTGVLLVVVGVVFVPGVTHLTYDAVGLGPTLWRLTWTSTVAALVGVLAAWLWARAPSVAVARIAAALAAVVLVVTGAPIWAADTSTSLHLPPHWQRGDHGRATAAWVIRQAGPGGLVLAPDGLSITITVTTTTVKTVAPRDYYLAYLRNEPGFHFDDRLRLVEFANDVPWRREDVGGALRTLGVDVACVYNGDLRGRALLTASGYRIRRLDPYYACATP
jgi:hypothetical protein